jgi:hypothetical protein
LIVKRDLAFSILYAASVFAARVCPRLELEPHFLTCSLYHRIKGLSLLLKICENST